jgi:guanylate kinase
VAGPAPTPSRPLVIVLSGPSGAGKDAVVDRMLERGLPVVRAVTTTSRAPRPAEVEGVDYFFVSRTEFERHIADGDLIEHADVYGDYKGLMRAQLRAALASGRHVIVRVDVQGAATFRRLLPGALFLFIVPESLDALEAQLRGRDTESEASLARRMDEARRELAAAKDFDYTIVNRDGRLDATVDEAWAIIEREAARTDRAAIEV